MEPLSDRLTLIDRHIGRAVAAAADDAGASPVLRAVLGELERKSHKARAALPGASPPAAREAVVELEQAADSANVAARADPGASEATRKLVDVAHMSICLLKAEGGAG